MQTTTNTGTFFVSTSTYIITTMLASRQDLWGKGRERERDGACLLNEVRSILVGHNAAPGIKGVRRRELK